MLGDYWKDPKKFGLAGVSIGLGTAYLCKTIIDWKTTQQKEYLRDRLVQRRTKEIESLKEILNEENITSENEIVKLSLKELIERLQSGQLQAEEVLKAYQAKAVDVHEKTNCLTGTVLDCKEAAKELDAQVDEKLPLHGVPLSVKDNIGLAGGYPCTVGCVNLAGFTSSEDAVLVKVLRSQGAVPFVRTNVPQLMMAYESSNLIYGATKNPHDTTRGSGGSSGGESALIGGGGSIIGLGTDIGGSIREPAAFCGICGLKPGSGRLSNKRGTPPAGQTAIPSTVGPMARDVESLAIMMRCMLVPLMYELDPQVPPLPFREEIYQSTTPLRIGWYDDDGFYPAVPAMSRAVGLAREALEKAGHTLVPWQPPNINEAISYIYQGLTGDGGETLFPTIKGYPVDACIKMFISFMYMSSFVRRLLSWYYNILGQDRMVQALKSFSGFSSVHKWWRYTTTVEVYRRQFADKFKEQQLDAIVFPSFTVTAAKLGSASRLLQSPSYTALYNVLDIPAGVVPVTRVSGEDVAGLAGYDTGDELGSWVREDQAGTEGLPVCVQVAALRWQDELVLRVMKEIQDAVDYK